MNEDQDKRRDDWYTPLSGGVSSEGRSALSADGAKADSSPRSADTPACYCDPYWSGGEQKPATGPKKKFGAVKIVAICFCVVTLIAATAMIFADRRGSGSGTLPEVTPTAAPGDSEDFSDDYKDFFNNYYTEDDSLTGDNTIPKADTGSGVTLQLSSLPADAQELSLQDVYDKCAPSVVAITADVGDGSYYWGTGIVLTADGYIITNTHVLEGTSSATVTLWDNTEYDAKLVGDDSISDIAVLKIEATGLTPAEFGDSDSLRVGDRVVAIGNPLGEELRGTMTDGIISAINRDITYGGHTMTLLQTNAAINEGNSGGPLINLYGQVVGITNMKMMSTSLTSATIEGIGFAIPSATMKSVVDALIASGTVTGRPAIGITVGPVPEDAANYYDLPDGLYVDNVSKGSDAEAKGIMVGDILTAVNGQPVTTTAEVSAIKDALQVGDTLTLTIYRSGETFDVDVVLVDSSSVY